MDEQWTTVAGVRFLPEEGMIGIKLGRRAGKWHKLDRASARALADLLSQAIAELDCRSFRPNDLGNYRPKRKAGS
jgi:hypothetical protein